MTLAVSPFVVAVKSVFMAEVRTAREHRKDTAQPTIKKVAHTFSNAMGGLNGTLVSRSELICGLGIACGQVLVSFDSQAQSPCDDVELEMLILAIAGGVVTEYRAGMAKLGADALLGKAFKGAANGKP